MRLGAKIEHPEVRPSMESFRFDAVPDQGNQPVRRGDLRRWKSRELQVKVEELERLYAAHFKIRLSEKSLEGDSLVRMVDVQENHMNQRGAEIRKGRAYCRYAEKRDAKLSAERGWKRREMEMLENKFEESWAQMKARRSRDDSEIKYRAQVGSNSLQTEEDDLQEQIKMLDRQANSSNYTLPDDLSTKRIGERKLLSAGKSSSYTRFQTSTAPIPKQSPRLINSDATNGSSRTVKASTQSLPNFSHLRKENMKPPTRVNKISTPPQSTARSNSSANLSELKDLAAINSYHNADRSSSKFSKQQSQKTISRKIEGKSEAVHRRTNGDSLAELRPSKAFEIQSKEDESANMTNQQTFSSDLDKMESIKTRPSIFLIESDTEEQGSSHESGTCDAKSEKHEILKYAGEEDNRLAAAASENKLPEESFQLCSSNIIHPSQSCVHVVSSYADSSVHAPTGNPVTWTTLHQTMMQEGDSTRVRRKWEITEKPKIASNNSDKLLKDVAKQFKKLLKFGRNGKNADNLVHTLASSPSASGGDDDTEDGHDISKLSPDGMKKSTSGYSSPCYVGLHEGKFLSGQVQSPSYFFSTSPANLKFRKDNQLEGFSKAACSVLSLLPFQGRGSNSKLK